MSVMESREDDEADILNNLAQTLAVAPGNKIGQLLGKRGAQRGKRPGTGKPFEVKNLTPSESSALRNLVSAQELVENQGMEKIAKGLKRKVERPVDGDAMDVTEEELGVDSVLSTDVLAHKLAGRDLSPSAVRRVLEVIEQYATVAPPMEVATPPAAGRTENLDDGNQHYANALHDHTFGQILSSQTMLPDLSWMSLRDNEQEEPVTEEDEEVTRTTGRVPAQDNRYVTLKTSNTG